MNVLQYRWYYINGDDVYYIIGDSAITLTVISVLQYRLVITLSVLITLSVVTPWIHVLLAYSSTLDVSVGDTHRTARVRERERERERERHVTDGNHAASQTDRQSHYQNMVLSVTRIQEPHDQFRVYVCMYVCVTTLSKPLNRFA